LPAIAHNTNKVEMVSLLRSLIKSPIFLLFIVDIG
jgi:hypothetical protein